MRFNAVLLLKCAVVGLLAIVQKPAFAAEPLLVKLRLSTGLSAVPAGMTQVMSAPRQPAVPAPRMALQLSMCTAPPVPSGGGGNSGDLLAALEKIALPENRRTAPANQQTAAQTTRVGRPEADGVDYCGSSAGDTGGSAGSDTGIAAGSDSGIAAGSDSGVSAGSAANSLLLGGPAIGGKSWQVAPIRWGGDLQLSMRYQNYEGQATTLNNMQTLNTWASSYLWQPWFAAVDGNLGLTNDISGGDADSTSQSISGNLSLTLFPSSRFPFKAGFSATNSKTDSSQYSEETDNRRYTLAQEYRPPTGNARYSVNYLRDERDSNISGESVVEKWGGTHSNSFGNHSYQIELNRTESSNIAFNEGFDFNMLDARHHWSPGVDLTVDSGINMNEAGLTQHVGSTLTQYTSKYLQASSVAQWRPKPELPLSLTGQIQFFDSDYTSSVSGGASGSSSTQVISGNFGATYQMTRNIGLSGNVVVTQTKPSSGKGALVSYQSANASYSSDPIDLGKFSYNWGASLGVTNTMGDGVQSSQLYTAAATHMLTRNFVLNPASMLSFNANQSLSTRWDSIYGQNSTLTTGASVGWQVIVSDSMSGSVRLSATDTRTIGTEESEYQFVSLSADARKQISNYSTLTANFSVGVSRNGDRRLDTGGSTSVRSPAQTTIYTSGTATYQHSRAFNIRNLQYSLMASMNTQQTDSRLLGDQDASANPSEYAVEQHLDYTIGRLIARLTGTVSVRDGKENTLIFLQVGRRFGQD